MPRYTFELWDGSHRIEDETGVSLPDREHVLRYAHEVVGELMSCREATTRSWCLDVYDDQGKRIFEVPFASIDPTLNHLLPELRTSIEELCNRYRSLSETIALTRATARETRALVARSRGRPYLASDLGRTTIRGD